MSGDSGEMHHLRRFFSAAQDHNEQQKQPCSPSAIANPPIGDEGSVPIQTTTTKRHQSSSSRFPTTMEETLVRKVVEDLAAKRSVVFGTDNQQDEADDDDADDSSTDEEKHGDTSPSPGCERTIGGSVVQSSLEGIEAESRGEDRAPSEIETAKSSFIPTTERKGSNKNNEAVKDRSVSRHCTNQRERRLERNRQTARERRKRKMLLIVQLQNTVHQLTAQNSELRHKNKRLKEDLNRFDEYMQAKSERQGSAGDFLEKKEGTTVASSSTRALAVVNESPSATNGEEEGKFDRIEVGNEGKDDPSLLQNEACGKKVKASDVHLGLKSQDGEVPSDAAKKIERRSSVSVSSGSADPKKSATKREPYSFSGESKNPAFSADAATDFANLGVGGIGAAVPQSSSRFLEEAAFNDVLLLSALQQQLQSTKQNQGIVSAAMNGDGDHQPRIFSTQLASASTGMAAINPAAHLPVPALSSIEMQSLLRHQKQQLLESHQRQQLKQQQDLLALLEESRKQRSEVPDLSPASLGMPPLYPQHQPSHLLHNLLLRGARASPNQFAMPSSLGSNGGVGSIEQLSGSHALNSSFPRITPADSVATPPLSTDVFSGAALFPPVPGTAVTSQTSLRKDREKGRSSLRK